MSGLVVTGGTDGTVLGIGYVLFKVPHLLLFAALTRAFAMVPSGAWVALTAAVLTLLLVGGTLWGIGLFGLGAGILLIADSFIQPALIGSSARLRFLVGVDWNSWRLQSVGLVGVFLGPVLMAALVTVWREWVGMGDRPRLG